MATKSTNPFSEFLPPATSGNASTSATPLVKRAQDSETEEIRRLARQPSVDAAAARTASLAPTQASLARPVSTLPGVVAVPFSGGATFTPPSMDDLGAARGLGASTSAGGVTSPRAEAVRAPVAPSPGIGPREANGGFAPTGPSQTNNYDGGSYTGATFAGTGIGAARQLPGGDKIPQSNDITRVITDPSGKVVGYARQASSPEAAEAISRAANPDGIAPGPMPSDLSPMDRRDYDRAVTTAREKTAAEAEERRLQPVWVSDGGRPFDGKVGTAFVNPNIARERAREREDAERAAISRSIGISEWNRGDNPSLNAISGAEVALSPGGLSTVGTNRDFRRQQVERGMGAELPGFLPTDMADRMRARQQGFGDKLQAREAEQNYFEGLSQTPAFERTFGPMNPRQDLRLSDREMARRIQMAQRS